MIFLGFFNGGRKFGVWHFYSGGRWQMRAWFRV